MTLELARPLLKKSSCAACIMCRALVFNLDPAAPVPVDLSAPLITAPLITSQLLITTYHIPTHHSSASHISLITAPLLITTHHSSTAHHNASQPHFWQVHFSSQLITTYHIPTHHSSTSHTSLLTPSLSHHNFSSQLITTYHIPTHHSSTSHTSLITSELITAPPLTPDITSPLLTPHFSHLPEVHINLRYIKAWHVGLSGPFIFCSVLLNILDKCDDPKLSTPLVYLHSKFPVTTATWTSNFSRSILCSRRPSQNVFKKAFPGNEARPPTYQISKKQKQLTFV